MMLRQPGWLEAADLIVEGLAGAFSAKTITDDFPCLMDDAKELSCSALGAAVSANM